MIRSLHVQGPSDVPWEVQWLNAKCAGLRIGLGASLGWGWRTLLCFWARRFTLTVPLFTQVYKMQWRIQGEGPGRPDPLSDLTLTTLRLLFLHWQDHISLFLLVIFFMKRAWHFSIKLNLGIFKNVNLLFLGTLLWSFCLYLQSSISRTNGDRLSVLML